MDLVLKDFSKYKGRIQKSRKKMNGYIGIEGIDSMLEGITKTEQELERIEKKEISEKEKTKAAISAVKNMTKVHLSSMVRK